MHRPIKICLWNPGQKHKLQPLKGDIRYIVASLFIFPLHCTTNNDSLYICLCFPINFLLSIALLQNERHKKINLFSFFYILQKVALRKCSKRIVNNNNFWSRVCRRGRKKEQQKILSDVSIFLLHANVAKCSLQKRSVKAKKSGTTTISSLEAINYNKNTDKQSKRERAPGTLGHFCNKHIKIKVLKSHFDVISFTKLVQNYKEWTCPTRK